MHRTAGLVLVLAGIHASAGVAGAQSPAVTFTKHVAPIVFGRCAACHRPGGPAPFSLLTYDAVREHANRIAAATASRGMPPWKADPADGPFVGHAPLTSAEIATIQRWVTAGTPEGDLRDRPRVPQWADGWHLGKPDLIVTSQIYALAEDGEDVFRVFVLPISNTSRRYVRGLEFRPENPRAVHHANILVDRTPTSRERNDADPTLGEKGLLAATAIYPEGHFLGWTPGPPDPLLPKGLAWVLEPGTDLVVQLHMKPTGKPEPVRFSVGLFFGDDPPGRAPAVLRLGRQTIDMPEGARNYTITDTYTLPVDVELLALKPHAHYRARRMHVRATLPGGATRSLLSINDWDFGWQHTYRFVRPSTLPRGTTLTMEYAYDNSTQHEHQQGAPVPPGRVRWGPRSSDEMGDLWVQVMPRTDGDLATLNRDFRRKWAAEDVAGYEGLLERDPGNVALHEDAALVYFELGRAAEAARHLRTVAALRPTSAPARFNLGLALARTARAEDAISEYEEAVRLDPSFAPVRASLATVLADQGRFDDALIQYQEAIRLEPARASNHSNLGTVLLAQGRPGEAVTYFREALRLDPQSADAHYNLGVALPPGSADRAAVDHLRDALRIRPDWPPALTRLAWVLSTTSDARLRDPGQAIRLAERAARLTNRERAEVLDVLAAAYAAAGQVERARKVTAEARGVRP